MSSDSETNGKEDIPKADKGNGLMLRAWPESAEWCEPVVTYGEGGLLPVHIGLQIGHYRVVHKLEHLRSSNIWLCRNIEAKEQSYYSVKVMRADESRGDNPELWIGDLFKSMNSEPPPSVHLQLPCQILQVESPNGSHDVMVSPLVGPPILHCSALRKDENGLRTLRKMCHQVTHALTVLHDRNLCHGDVVPGRILAQAKGFDGRSEEEIIKDIEEHKFDRVVVRATGEQSHKTFAPAYVIYKADWDDMKSDDIDITGKAYLSHFENAFKAGDSPSSLTIPITYCAPEWIFDRKGREPSDVWSLGCSLFEIRTGETLFPPTGYDFDQILALCMMLGKMPEPWWTIWPNRKKLLEDDVDDKGRIVPVKGVYLPHGMYRSIREAVETCWDHIDRRWPDPEEALPLPFDKKEVDLFVNLLERMLQWKPEDRIKKEELLDHPWFQL